MAVFGQIVHWPTVGTLVLFAVIVLVYVRLARREEGNMIARFGNAYRDYLQRVPMYFSDQGEWRRLFNAVTG